MNGQGKVSLPTGFISTVIAAKVIGCSICCIHNLVKQSRLKGKRLVSGKRTILAINKDSAALFSENHQHSKRFKSRRAPLSNPKQRKPFLCKGYKLVYSPTHPRAYHSGYVQEHVIIAEQTLGRGLFASEVVHHIDGDKLNNSPDNLKVYADHGAHMREAHNLLREFLKSANRIPTQL